MPGTVLGTDDKDMKKNRAFAFESLEIRIGRKKTKQKNNHEIPAVPQKIQNSQSDKIRGILLGFETYYKA